MKKKKLFITTTAARTLPFFKGQTKLWNEVFDVCAISSEKEKLINFSQTEGIRYNYMSMHREISLVSDVCCLLRFIWLFIKERPYIVHGNTPKASMLSMLAAWLTCRPIRIYMCHGLRYQTTTGNLRRILMFMEKLSCFCATQVFCVSEGVRKQLVKDGLCKEGKGKVVGYGTAGGIDVNYFSRKALYDTPDKRAKLGIHQNDFVFCFVGRVVKDKGINELVSAFDRLSQEYHVHLLLVGPKENDLDPIDESTQILISKNKYIYAVGRQNDVRPYLATSDAFVLPSYREGVGMVLLEANAMGVPCIASDIIGCHDVVTEGVNGELVQPRCTDALYQKMKEWVEHRERVAELAKGCRNYVLSRYTHEDVKNAYYQELQMLAGLLRKKSEKNY